MPRRICLPCDTVGIHGPGAVSVPGGFGGQGTVRSVTGLEIRPVLLRQRLLDGVAEAVILIERPASAGVDRLLQGQRSIRAKVFNQYAMLRRIVDHMLRGVVLADEAVIVDVARAIGVTDCLARLKSRPIESELIERAIDITRCELREMTAGGVVATIDREIAVDRLPEGEIAVGKEAFDRCGDAAGANDIVLGCVLLASNRG